MGAAVGNGNDVMDFFGGDIAPSFKTALAERMFGEIQGADDFPTPPIDLIGIRITAVPVVLAVGLRSVDFAVPAVGQVWAAGDGTGFLGFVRNNKDSFRWAVQTLRIYYRLLSIFYDSDSFFFAESIHNNLVKSESPLKACHIKEKFALKSVKTLLDKSAGTAI
jgi:hypothetical protein